MLPGERDLLANKSGATRLGFAVLLKLFRCAARFPQSRQEVPLSVVAFLAKQVRADDGGIPRVRFANATGFEDALRKQPNICERRADYRWRGEKMRARRSSSGLTENAHIARIRMVNAHSRRAVRILIKGGLLLMKAF